MNDERIIEVIARSYATSDGSTDPDGTFEGGVKIWEYYRDEARAALDALRVAGFTVVPVKLLSEAHAVMRACSWQLAPGSETQSDGVLEAAAAEIEDKFRDLIDANKSAVCA